MRLLASSLTAVAAIFCGVAHAEKTDIVMTGQQGVHIFLAVSKPWSQDMKYLENTARNMCAMKEICISHIWDKKSGPPKKFPLTDKQVDEELISHQYNRNSGRDKIFWNCKKFPNAPKELCMADTKK